MLDMMSQGGQSPQWCSRQECPREKVDENDAAASFWVEAAGWTGDFLRS